MSKLIKALASTQEETRDEALESLETYISHNITRFSKLDLQKLWKGVYYAVWLCDGGENQDHLTSQIGSIINKTHYKLADWIRINDTFWDIIIKEWENIDQWRMDKYYLLIRRVLNHNFKYLHNKNWDNKAIKQFNTMMLKPLNITKNYAIPYHLCDVYLDELELFDDVPQLILDSFKKVQNESKLKTLRQKIKEDVLDESRAQKRWHINNISDDENSEEDEEEEWTGF